MFVCAHMHVYCMSSVAQGSECRLLESLLLGELRLSLTAPEFQCEHRSHFINHDHFYNPIPDSSEALLV